MKAYVTQIERFSLKDGPGIRTTVFLQGCNMRCSWCHNPETIPMEPVEMFYAHKCVKCGGERVKGGTGERVKGEEGERVTHQNCPAGALVLSSKEMTLEEVMREIVQDKLYYKESGGGVTVSGGEPTLHPEFVMALADACHAEGIPIAIETNMSLPWRKLKPVLEKMDFIMCDFKLNSTVEHMKHTGVDNQSICNSIGRASKLGIPMIVRTPMIPGITDAEENWKPIEEYISKMDNIVRYERLAFNPLGASKREALAAARGAGSVGEGADATN